MTLGGFGVRRFRLASERGFCGHVGKHKKRQPPVCAASLPERAGQRKCGPAVVGAGAAAGALLLGLGCVSLSLRCNEARAWHARASSASCSRASPALCDVAVLADSARAVVHLAMVWACEGDGWDGLSAWYAGRLRCTGAGRALAEAGCGLAARIALLSDPPNIPFLGGSYRHSA